MVVLWAGCEGSMGYRVIDIWGTTPVEGTGVCGFVSNVWRSQVCIQVVWKERGKGWHFNKQKRENKKWNKGLVPDETGGQMGWRSRAEALKQDKGHFSSWALEEEWIEILMFVTQGAGSWRLSFPRVSISLWRKRGPHLPRGKLERGRGSGWPLRRVRNSLWSFMKSRSRVRPRKGKRFCILVTCSFLWLPSASWAGSRNSFQRRERKKSGLTAMESPSAFQRRWKIEIQICFLLSYVHFNYLGAF